MDKTKDTVTIKEELESLREKLNKEIVKNIEYKRKEWDESLLVASRELDNLIVDYIKSVKK